jgi:hypothetical protein
LRRLKPLDATSNVMLPQVLADTNDTSKYA